ncbi:SH3 domain-containing protein [Sphingomonas bacterium]|uniref:SH3 domain-containing protein n=1 Tax=Sphingomonas bacterium TaxID=1895847 RepID=UPI0020C730D5|nr:SH3 domain-containing protein [Sphingomonas bacterium]
MRGTMLATALAGAGLLTATPGGAADPKHKLPYFASIAAARARMRTGPGRSYPASWLYVRPDLPVKVLATFKEWRKVEDPGGTQGWMLANLLSDKRTGFVPGGSAGMADDAVELRDRPAAAGRVAWRAAPGVVGRLSQCADGWCRLDVRGQSGFVEQGRLWGVGQGEALP